MYRIAGRSHNPQPDLYRAVIIKELMMNLGEADRSSERISANVNVSSNSVLGAG
ncbi:hypothetical protein MGG_17569 [Pyricularia oryzae 70-15]|uniref:Uncharacterized protein n=1 Tax=Pyricularia oryzae (strain 70-15 / ATCC MYA-4617 / FGSC 8958) TaxID=242507 RepID=G4NFM9_PYRO7|nr:uncharacterized protein MGG_17569 [Pyricularia oryzae 70-15]EHA46836.1 hypothetical protein MGG_17569 [Pyricularia oryzae 70-15]